MATAARLANIDTSYISEILEVANSILRRHADHELTRNKVLLESCLEADAIESEAGHNNRLQNALSALTVTVHRHLNVEMEAVASLFVLGA